MISKFLLFCVFISKCILIKSEQVARYETTAENFKNLNFIEGLVEINNGTTCGDSLAEYLSGLQNTTLWALQMLDSSAKIPDGILFGNQKDLGFFDECIKIQHPSKLFVGQHCLLSVSLSLFPDDIGGNEDWASLFMPTIKNYGLCLPSTCTAQQIESGLNFIFNATHVSNKITVSLDEEHCRTAEPRKLKYTDWIAVGVLVAFGVIAIISTFYDVYQQFYRKNDKPHQLLSSFSLYSNGKFLFQISNNSDHFGAIHGIRVFSMFWVVLCHDYEAILEFDAPATNLVDGIEIMTDTNHVIINNGFLSVDSFFFLSGVVVCLVFFRDMSKKGSYDVPLGYIHRYIRLTPPYAVVMLVISTVLLYMGDGPLWYNVNEHAEQMCQTSWWGGLLYVQSFIQGDSNCYAPSWYLSTDMQLFWLSPLVLYVMYFFPVMAPYFLALMTILATFANFTVVYVNEFGPDFAVELIPGQMNIEYVRFYNRASPYLIGIATGYILGGIQAKKIKLNLSPLMVCVGWLAAAGLCLGSLYGITAFTDFEWTRLEAAFYAAFQRTMWGLGLAWLTVACVAGYGGPINGFLSWNIFQPLGKLSYCVFLTHRIVQMYRVGTLRTNIYAGDIELTWYFLGDLVMAHLVSIPLTLIFEIPFGNIDRYFLRNAKILPLPSKKNLLKRKQKPRDNDKSIKDLKEEGV